MSAAESSLVRGVPAAARSAGSGPLFVAWTRVQGRSLEIAAAIGGRSACFYEPPGHGLHRVLARYLRASWSTARLLLRERAPVIVTNPPLPAALMAHLCTRITRRPLILDSHPAAFIRTGPRRVVPDRINAWLIPRSSAVLVTVPELAARVDGLGGRGIVLHEAPPLVQASDPLPREERMRVLVVSVFAEDEPIWEVIEAAAALPETDFLITGALERRPPGMAERATANIRFVGFLPLAEYQRMMAACHVALVLDNRPESVSRSACDAIWARRPLIFSGSQYMRTLFSEAVPVANTASSITGGVSEALARYEELCAAAEPARRELQERWEAQREELLSALWVQPSR